MQKFEISRQSGPRAPFGEQVEFEGSVEIDVWASRLTITTNYASVIAIVSGGIVHRNKSGLPIGPGRLAGNRAEPFSINGSKLSVEFIGGKFVSQCKDWPLCTITVTGKFEAVDDR